MAAVLEYGGSLNKDVTMHPFFQSSKSLVLHTTSSDEQTDRNPRNASPSHHDDHDHQTSILSQPPITSSYTSAAHTNPQENVVAGNVQPLNIAPTNCAPSASEDLESDPNAGRKKRRRVSPKHTYEGLDRYQQLEAVIIPSPNPYRKILPALEPMCPASTTLSIDTESDSVKPVDIEGQRQDASLDGAADLRIQKTPKKNVLRIGANGKLTKSPRRSPGQVKVEDLNLKQSSKRVELKNGRLVSSMQIKLTYGTTEASRKEVGAKIQEILRKTNATNLGHKKSTNNPGDKSLANGSSKTTHPFFLGKVAPKPLLEILTSSTEGPTSTNVSEDEVSKSPIKAKPWQDIKFSSTKAFQSRSEGRLQPLWPPLELHRVEPGGHTIRTNQPRTSAPKNKSRRFRHGFDESEDVIAKFSSDLKSGQHLPELLKPQRSVTTTDALLQDLNGHQVFGCRDDPTYSHPAISCLRSRIKTRKTAFDRGVAADSQLWPIEYGPRSWQEVMQPQCKDMYEWLKGLKVHNVQKTSDSHSRSSSKTRVKKKKPKRQSTELDDFLADSDEDDIDSKEISNVLVLVGPSGCGKTASVFAVAHQLGFEVFEINPGTRRSAKDIYDRVGDVTRNHIVQRNAPRLPQGVVSGNENVACIPEIGKLKFNKSDISKDIRQAVQSPKVSDPPTLQNEKESLQKQSLILFEEVDLLFDDDKSFWTGVQSLAQQSKRPIVLTCNNLSSVPIDQLNIYSVLEYTPPPVEMAVELLVHIAAAEGHTIDRKALELLYRGKRHDLRASITELNFWCQMTVGSEQGGLDWMLPFNSDTHRIVSKDTYTLGLDIVPNIDLERLDLLKNLQDSLDLSVSQLEFNENVPESSTADSSTSTFASIQAMCAVADARSALALMDNGTAIKIASALDDYCTSSKKVLDRETVVRINIDRAKQQQYDRRDIQETLFPLNDDPRVFPAPVGRTGPSIDTTSVSMVTEVAPYVRAIVRHEQRLAMVRVALDGSDGKKARKTRAARAAVEGGDKSTTRRDRWFPRDLDFEAVLATRGKFVPEHIAISTNGEDQVPPSTASTVDEMVLES